MDEAVDVGRKPIPGTGYLNTCEYLGYIHGARRWRSPDGEDLLTWDSLHGEIEVYNTRGEHRGTKHAVSGVWVKDAVRGRRLDV